MRRGYAGVAVTRIGTIDEAGEGADWAGFRTSAPMAGFSAWRRVDSGIFNGGRERGSFVADRAFQNDFGQG